jgi:hypothetical protein
MVVPAEEVAEIPVLAPDFFTSVEGIPLAFPSLQVARPRPPLDAALSIIVSIDIRVERA